MQQIKAEEERLASQEAEVLQLNKELGSVSSALVQERAACREMRARTAINEATNRVLDASLQVYEEYSRRLLQETERLSFFSQEEEDVFALDSELMARSQLVQKLVAAARADEKVVRETMDEAEAPDSSVELMLYELQRQHVSQFVSTRELRAASASAGAGTGSESAKAKDLSQEAAELRSALSVLQAERDKLLSGQSDKLLLAHDVKDRVQELATLQRELKAVQDQIEAALAQGAAGRAALLELGSEVRALIQEHVLSMEGALEPLAEQLRDSVQLELDQFDRAPMAHLLRAAVSPQAAGLPPPLVRDLRIYASSYVLSSIAAALEFAPIHSFDHFLQHAQSLATEARDSAGAKQMTTGAPTEKANKAVESEKRVEKAFAEEAELIARLVLPLFQRVERATQEVEALKELVEKAFAEWKNLPAQFCIPQEEQRERFMRRYNYLRVLAHDAAKKGQK